MICKHCQTESDGEFCPNCGTPFEKEYADNYYPQQEYYQNYQQPYEAPKKKNNTLMIVLIAVAAVLVVGVFAVVGLLAKGGNKSTGDDPVLPPGVVQSTEEETTLADFEYKGNLIEETEPDDSIVEPDFLYNERTLYIEPEEGLILREGPGQKFNKILTIPYGKAVTIKGGNNGNDDWVYIFYSGDYGWVYSEFLSESKPTKDYDTGVDNRYGVNEYYSYTYSFTAVVSPSKGLNIRTGASTSSESLVVLPKGTEVTVLGCSAYNSDWYYVYCYYKGGYYYGFMSGEYLDW